MRLVICVDGDNKIGMGQVYRTINLAKVIKKKNNEVIFLTSSTIVKKMTKNEFKCFLIKKCNITRVKKILLVIKPEIIILDKLREKTKLLKIFKQTSKKLIAIDYIGNNKKVIDFGINILYPNNGIKKKNSFSGFEYTILNKVFKYTHPIKISKNVRRLLIVQGGADTNCLTPQIIRILNQLENKLKITVVLGPSFKCWTELEKSMLATNNKIKILHNVKNISVVMKKNDIAITSGGMTMLELCRLGIPSIVTCGASFENETAELLEKKGFGINLGYKTKLSQKQLLFSIKELISKIQKRKKMNQVGPALVDGKGDERAAMVILGESR